MSTSSQRQLRVASLFDHSGYMIKPWIDAGHIGATWDIQCPLNLSGGVYISPSEALGRREEYYADFTEEHYANEVIAWRPDIIFGFPPCTDLAVSGAAHFKRKAAKDPDFQFKAMQLFMVTIEIAKILGIPCIVENPVSVAAKMYRKPSFYWHPNEYGGYLDAPNAEIVRQDAWYRAEHPRFPAIIPPQDAYTKKTGAWMINCAPPDKKPVDPIPNDQNGSSPVQAKTGGKGDRTKEIRSLTPRGWAIAVKEKMEPLL